MSATQHTPVAPAPPEPAPEERAERSRVASRLLNQPLRNLGVAGAVVVLGSTAAFGGLQPAHGGSTPAPIEVGVSTHVAPYDIRINKVVWADSLPNVYPAQKGDRWLAVTATVRNTHTTSLGGGAELAESMTLSHVDGLVHRPEPGTDRVRSDYQKLLADTSDLDPVQPGIDYSMVFLFEQKAAVPPPTVVTVQLVNHTWRADSIDKTYTWLDPTVIAESTLPMIASASAAAAARASATPSVGASG